MANLQKQFKKYDSKIEKSVPQYSALLGKTKNIVRHPTRNGFCYARMADNLNELITVFNDKVSEVYNLPVKIERVGNNWHVVGRDTQRYPDWATQSSFVPSHHFQHEFNRDIGGGGGDVVFTYPDQFTPLLCYPYPTGSSGVMISPYLMQTASNFMYVGNTGSPDILSNKPTDDQANVGLIYLDKTTGNPGLVMGGSSFPATVTGTSALAPYFPFPTTTQEPLYFVRMVSGTTSIQWENLYNARQFIGGSSSGGGGSTAPVTDANNDFQVGISGTWVKKTLAETQTILEVIPEAPFDSNYYGRSNGEWENITWYTDELYLALSEMSASEAQDLTDGGETTLHSHAGSMSQMTNKSGAGVVAGDVLVFNTTATTSFMTTTYPLDLRVCGVAFSTIANDATGSVVTNAGTITNVNCDTGAVAIGQYLVTSTTAGLAKSAGYFRAEGTFGIALSAKAAGGNGTVSVMLIDNYRQAIVGNAGYSIGGYNGSSAITTAQRFSIATATWSGVPTANLNAAKYSAGSLTYGTIRFYYWGGWDGATYRTSEDMQFATETTSVTAGVTNQQRQQQKASASSPADGFLCGGFGSINVSTINKMQYSTSTSSVNSPMSSIRAYQSIVSDGLYCYIRGGTSVVSDLLNTSTYTVSANPSCNLPAATPAFGTFSFSATYGYQSYKTGAASSSRRINFSTGTDSTFGSTTPSDSGYSVGVTDGLNLAWLCGSNTTPYTASSKFDRPTETFSADAGAVMPVGVYYAGQGSYATFC